MHLHANSDKQQLQLARYLRGNSHIKRLQLSRWARYSCSAGNNEVRLEDCSVRAAVELLRALPPACEELSISEHLARGLRHSQLESHEHLSSLTVQLSTLDESLCLGQIETLQHLKSLRSLHVSVLPLETISARVHVCFKDAHAAGLHACPLLIAA